MSPPNPTPGYIYTFTREINPNTRCRKISDTLLLGRECEWIRCLPAEHLSIILVWRSFIPSQFYVSLYSHYNPRHMHVHLQQFCIRQLFTYPLTYILPLNTHTHKRRSTLFAIYLYIFVTSDCVCVFIQYLHRKSVGRHFFSVCTNDRRRRTIDK